MFAPGCRVRSLLNSLSTVEIVLLFVGGAALLAVAGVIVVELVFPGLRESPFEEGSAAIKATFTLLFGLILALTISNLSSNSSNANTVVSNESTALTQMSRNSQDLHLGERLRVRAAIDQYLHAVAEDEFATMRASGTQSPLAAAALANLYGVYQAYTPKPTEAAAYSASVSELSGLSGYRRTRLQDASQSLSPLLRVMLILGTVLFIVLSYPARIKHKGTRIAVVGGIAAFVTFVFVLTIVLDYPFSGQVATSNAPYKDGVLAQFWPAI